MKLNGLGLRCFENEIEVNNLGPGSSARMGPNDQLARDASSSKQQSRIRVDTVTSTQNGSPSFSLPPLSTLPSKPFPLPDKRQSKLSFSVSSSLPPKPPTNSTAYAPMDPSPRITTFTDRSRKASLAKLSFKDIPYSQGNSSQSPRHPSKSNPSEHSLSRFWGANLPSGAQQVPTNHTRIFLTAGNINGKSSPCSNPTYPVHKPRIATSEALPATKRSKTSHNWSPLGELRHYQAVYPQILRSTPAIVPSQSTNRVSLPGKPPGSIVSKKAAEKNLLGDSKTDAGRTPAISSDESRGIQRSSSIVKKQNVCEDGIHIAEECPGSRNEISQPPGTLTLHDIQKIRSHDPSNSLGLSSPPVSPKTRPDSSNSGQGARELPSPRWSSLDLGRFPRDAPRRQIKGDGPSSFAILDSKDWRIGYAKRHGLPYMITKSAESPITLGKRGSQAGSDRSSMKSPPESLTMADSPTSRRDLSLNRLKIEADSSLLTNRALRSTSPQKAPSTLQSEEGPCPVDKSHNYSNEGPRAKKSRPRFRPSFGLLPIGLRCEDADGGTPHLDEDKDKIPPPLSPPPPSPPPPMKFNAPKPQTCRDPEDYVKGLLSPVDQDERQCDRSGVVVPKSKSLSEISDDGFNALDICDPSPHHTPYRSMIMFSYHRTHILKRSVGCDIVPHVAYTAGRAGCVWSKTSLKDIVPMLEASTSTSLLMAENKQRIRLSEDGVSPTISEQITNEMSEDQGQNSVSARERYPRLLSGTIRNIFSTEQNALKSMKSLSAGIEAKDDYVSPWKDPRGLTEPMARMLRHREMGGRYRPRDLRVNMANKLHPMRKWKGASSDVVTVAWAPDSTKYVIGAATHTNTEDLQYNRPCNLLAGDINTDKIWELPDHRRPRPRPETIPHGPNSSFDTYDVCDAYVYYTVNSARYSTSGNLLYTASRDKTLRVWDVLDGAYTCRDVIEHDDIVSCIEVAPRFHGTFATANACIKNSVRVYFGHDSVFGESIKPLVLSSPKALARQELQILPECLRWGPTQHVQQYLLAGFTQWTGLKHGSRAVDGQVCLWDVNTGDALKVSPSVQSVSSVVWHPELPLFATGGSVNSHSTRKTVNARTAIRIWDLRSSGLAVNEYESKACEMQDVTFHPTDSYTVTAGCTNGVSYVWDRRFGDIPIHELHHGDSVVELDHNLTRDDVDTGVRMSAWGLEGSLYYTGSSDGIVKTWDVRRHADDVHVRDVVDVGAAIQDGAFSPDHGHLLIGDADGGITVLSTSALTQTPEENDSDDDKASDGQIPTDQKKNAFRVQEEFTLIRARQSDGSIDGNGSSTVTGIDIDIDERSEHSSADDPGHGGIQAAQSLIEQGIVRAHPLFGITLAESGGEETRDVNVSWEMRHPVEAHQRHQLTWARREMNAASLIADTTRSHALDSICDSYESESTSSPVSPFHQCHDHLTKGKHQAFPRDTGHLDEYTMLQHDDWWPYLGQQEITKSLQAKPRIE